ncbi:MAG: class I SAM-dependent methyltransferase [Bdellovibrionaceae bacterium]|nr:class I SAM-dependent methyltransferase [Pseudobdellovibrionaceae bacterium]
MKKLKLDAKTKYELYIKSVQSPDTDVIFYRAVYKELRGKFKKGLTLREDFCGTGIISSEWTKLDKTYKSFGVDLDPEPMEYGQKNFVDTLSLDQQKRIELVQMNVLNKKVPQADIVVAVNFSYCLFREREQLKKYFQNVYKSIKPGGLYIIDVFGGSQCADEVLDRTKHKGYTYYWDQKSFDPVSGHADFAIHFRIGSKFYKDVFTYDWRVWTIPELREIMKEVGFKDSVIYWEGTTRKGSGNGKFTQVAKGEACLSWISYIAGVK